MKKETNKQQAKELEELKSSPQTSSQDRPMLAQQSNAAIAGQIGLFNSSPDQVTVQNAEAGVLTLNRNKRRPPSSSSTQEPKRSRSLVHETEEEIDGFIIKEQSPECPKRQAPKLRRDPRKS